MKIAVEKLNETGAIVVNLTCDNPSNNWAMLSELGAKLNLKGLKVSLDLYNGLGKHIYATPDVCHLLKLVRNTLGDLKYIHDGDDGIICWKYIAKLQEVQHMKGLHMATKLRNKHINWQGNKMSVTIAAQILSASVANAIDYCRDTLKMKEFEGSEATTRFIRTFDKLFDILNSRNRFGRGLKAPIKQDNYDAVSAYFKEAVHYITSV